MPRSTSPSSKARSISLTKRALSPPLMRGRAPAQPVFGWWPSDVLIGTISAPPSAFATCSACASARARPRVRSRIGRSATVSGAFVPAAPLLEGGDVGAVAGLRLGAGVEAEELAKRTHLKVGIFAVRPPLQP